MISKFPNFTKFNLEQKEIYQNYIKNFAPYGDFSFVNLCIWLDIRGDLELSDLSGNLVLRFTNVFSVDKEKSYSFIGLVDVDHCLELLGTYIRENDQNPILYSVPEETIKLVNKHKYEEDRDSFDYILDTDEQVRLLGTKFGKYRRRVNSFISNNIDGIIIKELNLDNKDDFNNLVNSLHSWKRTYELGGNDVEGWEAIALTKSFKNCSTLGLRCIAVYIDNKIEAFSLFSINEDQSTADIHHTKCSYEHRNVFDFTLFAVASKLRSERIKYMNLEQDLGIDGLREHKLGLRPAYFLKKYSINL